jgi:two-component system LytT family response regulator
LNQSTASIRTLIVDDEELARRGIELRLRKHAAFEVVNQCANGREALAAIADDKPDVVFLDIQMPRLSGLEVLERLPQESMPVIVFVTAFDQHALQAFDAQALDYLLKPINDERFIRTLERVRTQLLQRQAATQRERLMQLLAATRGVNCIDATSLQAQTETQRYAAILPLNDQTGTIRMPVSSIDWIDAAGDYMCVHTEGRTYVLRETMKSLEALLDPDVFCRVHRSTIVNISRVRRLQPHMNGEYFLTLEGEQQIKLSRSYRDQVDRLLQRRP